MPKTDPTQAQRDSLTQKIQRSAETRDRQIEGAKERAEAAHKARIAAFGVGAGPCFFRRAIDDAERAIVKAVAGQMVPMKPSQPDAGQGVWGIPTAKEAEPVRSIHCNRTRELIDGECPCGACREIRNYVGPYAQHRKRLLTELLIAESSVSEKTAKERDESPKCRCGHRKYDRWNDACPACGVTGKAIRAGVPPSPLDRLAAARISRHRESATEESRSSHPAAWPEGACDDADELYSMS